MNYSQHRQQLLGGREERCRIASTLSRVEGLIPRVRFGIAGYTVSVFVTSECIVDLGRAVFLIFHCNLIYGRDRGELLESTFRMCTSAFGCL